MGQSGPKFYEPLSNEEVMALTLKKGVSISVILMVAQKDFTDEGYEILIIEEVKDFEKRSRHKMPGGRMHPEDLSPLHAGKRILEIETGFTFDPKVEDICLAGKFSSTDTSQHFKIFIFVSEFTKGLPPEKEFWRDWIPVENLKKKIVKAQHFCLRSLEDRLKILHYQKELGDRE